ncbi:MAG TPA: hypothetical protein VEU96_25470 [Bryobacteraceae bacterium]|nr:hypothetical protein [Bryobacteraceae bacterium]
MSRIWCWIISLLAVAVVCTAQVTFTEFPIPGGNPIPFGITAGPDGNLWFTERQFGDKIASITTAGVLTEYALPNDGSPTGITTGPDGNLWFTELGGSKIGRITTTGVITEFPTLLGGGPFGIAVGPDGNLWFTMQSANQIGRITTAGAITYFSIPTSSSLPNLIAAGPDGNLWFTEFSGNKIGRITTAGAVTEFTVPTSNSLPFGITAGPDGNVWFTEEGGNKIGSITPSGVISEFPIPTSNTLPVGITTGPDGSLWFTENSEASLGRITTAGAITELPMSFGGRPYGITAGADGKLWFTLQFRLRIGTVTPGGFFTIFPYPTGSTQPYGIAAGPDGNLWFTESDPFNGGKVGRITTAGAFTEFPLPIVGSNPTGITAGPDGNVWFTEYLANKIGKITPSGVIAEFPIPTGVSTPVGIATGADGNLWFTEAHAVFSPSPGPGKIGRITPAGVIMEFPVPPGSGPNGDNYPYGITAGPDGNLWFTELVANRIGRITTAGVITEFPLPPGSHSPIWITAGQDGNLWFTQESSNQIGRITTSGVITEFSVPPGFGTGTGITAAPDGNLWFAGGHARITPTGVVTAFCCPVGLGIAVGSDGNLWTTEIGRNRIGKATLIFPNTPAGTNVVVQPTNQTNSATPVTLAFSSVSQAGETTLATNSSAPAPPAGVALGTPPVYYNLATTATFTGTISICINYTNITFTTTPSLFHFEGGSWVDVTTSQDTVNQIVCGSVTSLSPFALFRKLDATPPVIVPKITGTAGTNGWYTSNVAASWSVTDPESGITSSTGCGSTTLTANTPGTTLTCSATNGAGLSNSVSVTLKIDQTSPVIVPTITGTAGTNGWYTSNVTVSWNVTDPESAIASSTGCSSTTLTADTSGTTLSCSAQNGAGLSTSTPVTVKIDRTPPAIIGMPAAGCSLWPPNQKMVEVATVTSTDALSGLAPNSFAVTGTSNEPADPSNPDIVITPSGSGGYVIQLRADRLGSGTGRIYTLSATAMDLAGNTATSTATCVVPHDQGQ